MKQTFTKAQQHVVIAFIRHFTDKKTSVVIVFLLCCIFSEGQKKDSIVAKPTFDTLNNKLKNVIVTAQKNYIERQIDKTVLNVQNDITAASSTLLEIIQKAPGVSVINDETIKMNGKAGVNVLIDGRPTQMSEKDLAIFLKSTPGTVVDKIEIITNPSSKYDAQGNAGIINIKLKKNKLQGTNGNISVGYTQQTHYRRNLGVNINHLKNKLNIFGNYTYGNNLQHTAGNILRNVTTVNVAQLFENNTTDIDPDVAHNFRAGIDFYANKKSTFGMLVSGSFLDNPFKTIGSTEIKTNGLVDSSLNTVNTNPNNYHRLNYNLNYRFEDTLGNDLTVDANYSSFKNNNDQQVETNYFSKQLQPYYYAANRLQFVTDINIYSFKADFTKTLKKQVAKIETGIKLNRVTTDNDLDASKLANNSFMPDTGRTNNFNYAETVLAAYANYSKKVKKVEYQIGFRMEQSNIKGISTDIKNNRINNPDTSYVNIFPTGFLRYTINPNNNVGISYSGRINRPNYQDLNPFENIIDAYTSEKGNPYLRPSYGQNVELSYNYHDALNITFGYSHTNDYSQTITQQIGNQVYSQPLNVGVQNNYYLNINLPIPITKWWYSYTNVSSFYAKFNGQLPDGNVNTASFGVSWYLTNSFTLGKGWKAQMSSWGNGATKDALFTTKALGSLDLGLQKTVLKEKGSLRLGIIDIFNTQRFRQSVNYANQNYSVDRKWESRGIRLQFSWKVGNQKIKTRQRSETSDDATDRIKGKKD